MFPSDAFSAVSEALLTDSSSKPTDDSMAIDRLKRLMGTDRATLELIASYAHSNNPEVMQVLINKLILMLKEPNNKWVFAAIGAACCISILNESRHFAKNNTSLPIKLLRAVVDSVAALHVGRNADLEALQLGLLALNASMDILLANEIGAIEKPLYEKTKALLKKIQGRSTFPETLLFLAEQARCELKAIGCLREKDSNKSAKGHAVEGGINFLLGMALVGAGVTGFVVSVGAATATGGILAPIVLAGAFSFSVSAGFATERFYNSLKSLKRIGEIEQESGRFSDLLSALPWSKEETEKGILVKYEEAHWEALVTQLITDFRTSLTGFETKQLVFTLVRLLESKALEESYRAGLMAVIEDLYAHQVDKKKGKADIRRFILEQIKGLQDSRPLVNDLADLQGRLLRLAGAQDRKRSQQLSKEFVACFENRDAYMYPAVPFKVCYESDVWETQGLVKEMGQLHLESDAIHQAGQAGLASQRLINKVQLVNQEEAVDCMVLPTSADGNCGFSAIKACLQRLDRKDDLQVAIRGMNRVSFIETVQATYGDAKTPEALKELIEAMFAEDACDTLGSWTNKFSASSVYMGKSHLCVLSYLYHLRFHIYCVSEKAAQFEPESLSETITGFEDDDHRALTPIHLAHIVAGLRGERCHPNHFEGLIIEPLAGEKEANRKLHEKSFRLSKANKELAPFIAGKALLHPNAVKREGAYEGSTVNDYKSLQENPRGFIDKSEFLLALLANEDNKALLRPRRSGKTMLLSMANEFFSVLRRETSEALFHDLNVSKYYPSFYGEHRGRYPVLLLDLKDIVGFNFDEAVKEFRLKVVDPAYARYASVLLESTRLTAQEKAMVGKYANPLTALDRPDVVNGIGQLTQWLYKHYEEKVMVLVDEYDAPLIKALQRGSSYYEDFKQFITQFFSVTFKGNSYLKTAVFTGIMDARGAGIFSDLNNVETFTFLNDNRFGPYIGFTPEEIEQYLALNGLYSEALMKDIKRYFNGYICLHHQPRVKDVQLEVANFLFNTFSVEQCVKNQGLVKSYWIESSSSHQLLIDVIKRADSAAIESQILELAGDYLHHVVCAEKPTVEEKNSRGIYLYRELEDSALMGWVVHNDYTHEYVDLSQLESEITTTYNVVFPMRGAEATIFDGVLVEKILSLCLLPEAREGFSVSTPLKLTNLDFLVKTHINTAEDIYCLLFYAGYLTFTGRTKVTHGEVAYELKIPNEEIMLMFKYDIVPQIKQQMCQRANRLACQDWQHSGNRIFGFHAQLPGKKKETPEKVIASDFPAWLQLNDEKGWITLDEFRVPEEEDALFDRVQGIIKSRAVRKNADIEYDDNGEAVKVTCRDRSTFQEIVARLKKELIEVAAPEKPITYSGQRLIP